MELQNNTEIENEIVNNVINGEVAAKDVPHNKRTPLEDVVPLPQPYVLYIDPCGACNLTCTFCPCNTVKENHVERHKMMSFELFEKIVEDLKGFPEKLKVVYLFCYGEPLINPRIFDMIRYLRKSDVCEKIRMYSNGLLLTPEISDQLVDSGLDLFRISLNGLNAEHYKEFCGVTMDYEKFHENLKYFYQVSRGKVEFAIKIANLFLDTEENKQLSNHLFLNHCDYFFVEDIYENWSGFDGVTTKEEQRLKQGTKLKEICTNPMTMMVIHANGLVSPCCADWKQAVTYGDVKEEAVADIWNSEEKNALMISLLKREEGKYPFCDDCQFDAVDNVDEEARTIILGRLEKV